MEKWWNAPLWWRERQFHSFLLINTICHDRSKKNITTGTWRRCSPFNSSSRYDWRPVWWSWVHLNLQSFFISYPCTIPVNAIDKAQDWENVWTPSEGLNLLKAASHAHCLMTFRVSTDVACGSYRTAGVCKKLSTQLTASNFSVVGHIPQFSNFKKFQNQPPGF